LTAFFNCSDAKKLCLDRFKVKKFPTLYAYLPHNNSTITNVEERIKNSVLFPIGKGYKEKEYIQQIHEVFPSKVENVTSLNFPFLLQEAKIEKQLVVVDMYLNDEPVLLKH
jgi:hypothetical protein